MLSIGARHVANRRISAVEIPERHDASSIGLLDKVKNNSKAIESRLNRINLNAHVLMTRYTAVVRTVEKVLTAMNANPVREVCDCDLTRSLRTRSIPVAIN